MGKLLIIAMNDAREITGCGQYSGDLGAAIREAAMVGPPDNPGATAPGVAAAMSARFGESDRAWAGAFARRLSLAAAMRS